MIAEAILKCNGMALREFQASRDRLEDKGFTAMAEVFAKQQSLEVLEVYQNGAKHGFKALLKSLIACQKSIRSINVSDNLSINSAVPEFCQFIAECDRLSHINISDLNLKSKHFLTVAHALFKSDSLQSIVWNYDLQKSTKLAKEVIAMLSQKKLDPRNKLTSITMSGVFMSKKNRDEARALFPEDCGIKLSVFEPSFTDEESDDVSEEDSDHEDSEEEEQPKDEKA